MVREKNKFEKVLYNLVTAHTVEPETLFSVFTALYYYPLSFFF